MGKDKMDADEYIVKLKKLHDKYRGDFNDEYWKKAAELNQEYKKD